MVKKWKKEYYIMGMEIKHMKESEKKIKSMVKEQNIMKMEIYEGYFKENEKDVKEQNIMKMEIKFVKEI